MPRSIETHHILCVSRVGSPYRGGTTNGDATRATLHERRTDGDLRYSLQEGKRKLSTERRFLGYWSQYIWWFCGKFPYRRHNMWWFCGKLPYIWWFCGDFAYRDFSHGSPPGPRPTEKQPIGVLTPRKANACSANTCLVRCLNVRCRTIERVFYPLISSMFFLCICISYLTIPLWHGSAKVSNHIPPLFASENFHLDNNSTIPCMFTCSYEHLFICSYER